MDDGTLRFMRALPKATSEPLPDGSEIITLPDDADGKPVFWLGMRSNKLFVRPIFRLLYDDNRYLNGFKEAADWLLRGIPGIGKSSFGLYCLWRLVCAKKRVRYWYPRGSTSIIDFGSKGALDAYIVDGTAPATLPNTPTLLISSPRGGATLDGAEKAHVYDDFVKHPKVRNLFLRPPTVEQILLLGSSCYPTVPVADIHDCIRRWGPVIRPIFAADRDEESKALAAAIGLQNVAALKKLASTMSETVAIKDVSFRVVHYDIDDSTCSSYRGFKWGSDYIEQQVFEMLQKHEARDRLSLLQEMLTRKSSLAMCHKLFEDWCNTVMRQGSGVDGFRVRRLGVGNIRGAKTTVCFDDAVLQAADRALGLSKADAEGIYRLHVPGADTQLLRKSDDWHESAAGRRTRWKARACFAAADFIEASGVCSNATVSDTHELLLQGAAYNNGLRAILERVRPSALKPGATNAVPFLWLVPSVIFPDFDLGTQVVETGSTGSGDGSVPGVSGSVQSLRKARSTARQLGRRVVQYAVEIPNPDDFSLRVA